MADQPEPTTPAEVEAARAAVARLALELTEAALSAAPYRLPNKLHPVADRRGSLARLAQHAIEQLDVRCPEQRAMALNVLVALDEYDEAASHLPPPRRGRGGAR